MLRIFAVLTFCGSIASAETSVIPRLADGTTDVEAVMSSFNVSHAPTDGADVKGFDGEILGGPFHVTYSWSATPEPITMRIYSSNLPEEATFMVSVLLTDIICLQKDVGVQPVKWRKNAIAIKGGWQVQTHCNGKSRSGTPDVE